MVETSKRRPRLTSNAPIYAAMVLIGIGLIVLVMFGCQSQSRITPATSTATRTTESRGPKTTLRVRSIPPKAENRPNFQGANP